MSDSIQSKGGKARAESLSPVERTEIARRAAETRWSDKSFGVVSRCFTFPIVSGVVTISVPFPMSEDDYISLTEILKIMKPGLVRTPPQPGLSGREGQRE